MPDSRPWSDENIRKLLSVRGFKAMSALFPGVSTSTLHSAQMRYKNSRPDLLPSSTAPKMAAWPRQAEQPDPDRYVTREAHEKILRELHAVKHKRADYIEAVMQAATEAIQLIDILPVPSPQPLMKSKRINTEEVAVALLSDLQTGKVTPDYNTEICRQRVLNYARKIVSLAELQRKDHPVRKCVVAMLGDMVEGVDIFPGQQWLLDSTLYRQIFESTPTIIVDFLRILLAGFEEVEVQAVQGNHGRIGRKGVFGPEDNSDRMVYRLVKLLMRDDPRLTFEMADPTGERAWYKVIDVGNYRAMLIHGDQIRGANGYPWYGLGKKVHSWASGGVEETFDDIFLGHYHQLGAMPLNKRVAWANGAIESTNTFAAETMASQSDPKQWLLFVHPGKGCVTAAYPVYLLNGDSPVRRKR